MLRDILRGLNYYSEAFSVIREARLWRYFIISGAIGLIVFAAFGLLLYKTYDLVGDLVAGLIPWEFDWLGQVGDWFTVLSSSIVFLLLFRYVMLVILAPLMSRLSGEVEAYLYHEEKGSAGIGTFISEMIRGLRIALRNIIREIFWTILLFILGLFPLFSLLTGPLLVLIQSYYAGFGTIDYWAERHMSYRETVNYLSKKRGMLIGNGIVYLFLIAVPFLGVIFIPTLSTVAGTLHACESWEEDPY